jgi:hypothetical protein
MVGRLPMGGAGSRKAFTPEGGAMMENDRIYHSLIETGTVADYL